MWASYQGIYLLGLCIWLYIAFPYIIFFIFIIYFLQKSCHVLGLFLKGSLCISWIKSFARSNAHEMMVLSSVATIGIHFIWFESHLSWHISIAPCLRTYTRCGILKDFVGNVSIKMFSNLSFICISNSQGNLGNGIVLPLIACETHEMTCPDMNPRINVLGIGIGIPAGEVPERVDEHRLER